MKEPKYTYSQMSSHSAARLATYNYNLAESISCIFYILGLHDNYLIEGNHGKYILRVYRNDWRSLEEIRFELELLAFLGAKNARIAYPLPTKSGELGFFINSPEGQRIAALFYYADGCAPGNKISLEESALLGEAVARIHQTTELFETAHTRQILDIPYLLDESIIAIEPFIGIEEQNYLHTLQKALKETLPSLPREAEIYGICIGDVSPSNFHINDKKEITLFDFDQCGYGYRAFEIGKFFSSIQSVEMKHDITKSFIDGYQSIRRLGQEELMAIPYFEIISVIWVMAIHAYNADRIGYKRLEKPFWDRQLAFIKELDKQTPVRLIQ